MGNHYGQHMRRNHFRHPENQFRRPWNQCGTLGIESDKPWELIRTSSCFPNITCTRSSVRAPLQGPSELGELMASRALSWGSATAHRSPGHSRSRTASLACRSRNLSRMAANAFDRVPLCVAHRRQTPHMRSSMRRACVATLSPARVKSALSRGSAT